MQKNRSDELMSGEYKNFLSKISPMFNHLYEKRIILLSINGIVLILALVYLLFIAKPYFESTVQILPEYGTKSTAMLNQISGIASLAGVNFGEASPTEIYENLVYSEAVLYSVIYSKYTTEKYSTSINLIEYFEIEPDEDIPAELRERKRFLKVFEILTESRITTQVERVTRILSVTVKMPEAELAAEVVNRIVSNLNKFINQQKKSYASEERIYLENRITEISDSLGLAENELKEFREKNRDVKNSPELLLQLERLQRKVQIKETIYVELVKQFELVKLDEVKDTPAINIREYAKNPVEKAGPRRTLILILLMFLSGILSTVYIILLPILKGSWNFLKSK